MTLRATCPRTHSCGRPPLGRNMSRSRSENNRGDDIPIISEPDD